MERNDIPPDDREAPVPDRRARLRDLKRARRGLEPEHGSRQSLEGLRLGALLRQLEALQALQGLQELKPGAATPRRLKISDDPAERARHRQWLRFKADWLEALLESTLEELEALEAYETPAEPKPEGAGPQTP
jgi:hypothetical protein